VPSTRPATAVTPLAPAPAPVIYPQTPNYARPSSYGADPWRGH
jgi:hypothetical protein